MTNQLKTFIASLPLLTGIVLTLANPWSRVALADGVDRIVAVVEDDVILESELQKKIAGIREGLSRSGTAPPSGIALARQVLDRLILEKIQIHLAEKSGFRVDDETLRQTVQQIAGKNNLTPEELRSSLRAEGIEYPDFLEQIRGELAQQRLRTNQVNSQIKISDREIQHWLDSRGKGSANPNTEYLIGHILIATRRPRHPLPFRKPAKRPTN